MGGPVQAEARSTQWRRGAAAGSVLRRVGHGRGRRTDFALHAVRMNRLAAVAQLRQLLRWIIREHQFLNLHRGARLPVGERDGGRAGGCIHRVRRGAVVEVDGVLAATTDARAVAHLGVDLKRVVAAAADGVVAGAQGHLVRAVATAERIIGASATEGIIRTSAAEKCVGAFSAQKRVGAAAQQLGVTIAAKDCVVAARGLE
jgi:hypothetical protein